MNVTLTDEGYTLDGKWRLVPVELTYDMAIQTINGGLDYRLGVKSATNPPQSLSSIPPDCRTCANRGRVNGLSQESYCDGCVYQGRSWRQNHFVLAVKRRCEACAILPCSCK